MKTLFNAWLLLVAILLPCFFAKAEGTKELQPFEQHRVDLVIRVNQPNFSQFATYMAEPNERLYFSVKNTSEVIYLGMRQGSNDVFFRVKRPNGTVILGPILVPSAGAGFIQNYDRAVAGPTPLVGATGYQPIVINPDTIGDFYIEFNPGTPFVPATNQFERRFQFFDITVAANGQAQKGRLWSQYWGLVTNSLNTPFFGKLYTYTNYGIISEIDFNGIRPYGFDIACNPTGCTNTGNAIADRKSRYGNFTYPQYKIFLNVPDTTVFPVGKLGKITASVSVFGCQDLKFCLSFTVDSDGLAESYIDLNGIAGYQPNSADIYIAQYIDTAGTNCVEWDGKDGLGNQIPLGSTFQVYSTFKFGITHLPMFDVESHTGGFKVKTIAPASTQIPALFWDDSIIVTGNAIDGLVNLEGCTDASGCHKWSNRGVNNNNSETINTWWYAFVDNDTATFTFQEDNRVNISPQIGGLFGNDITLCIGDSINFYPVGLQDTSLYDFSWKSNNNSLLDTSKKFISQRFYDSTEIYLTVTQKLSGCNSTDTIRINTRPPFLPQISKFVNVANPTDTVAFCVNTPENLFVYDQDLANPIFYSYQWSSNDFNLTSTNNNQITHAFTTEGTIKLTVTNNFTGCSGTDSVYVKLKAPTTADLSWDSTQLITNDTAVCIGTQLNLFAFGKIDTSLYDFDWKLGNQTFDKSYKINWLATNSGKILLTIEDKQTNCIAKDSLNVMVFPIPSLDLLVLQNNQLVLPENITFCANTPLQLQASVPPTTLFPYHFLWQIGNNTLPESTLFTQNIIAQDTVAISVIVTDTMTNCRNKDSITIRAFPAVTAQIVENDTAICFATNITRNAANPVLHYQYNWLANAQNIATNTPTVTFNAAQNTWLLLQAIDTNSGCTATDSIFITKNNKPTLTSIVTQDFCGTSAGAITVNATGGTGNYAFLWSNGATSNNLSNLTAGTYILLVTDTTTNCAAAISVPIVAFSPLQLSTTTKIDSCEKRTGSMQLTASGGTGNYSFVVNGTTFTQPLISNLAAGNYNIVLKDDSTQCEITGNATITATPALRISETQLNAPICDNQNGSIEVQANLTTVRWWWNGNEGNNRIQNLPASNYRLVAQDSVNGCAIDTTFVLPLQFENPQANFFVSSDTLNRLFVGESITLNSNSSNASKIIWQISNQVFENQNSITLPLTQAENTRILLVAQDRFGCADSIFTTLRIQSRPLLKDCVPNIISPNQDGKNDKFEIRFAELFSPISLKIYNRWGKQLENIDNYKQDFEGKNLPSGTYFIEVITPKDGKLQQWLQVIR